MTTRPVLNLSDETEAVIHQLRELTAAERAAIPADLRLALDALLLAAEMHEEAYREWRDAESADDEREAAEAMGEGDR